MIVFLTNLRIIIAVHIIRLRQIKAARICRFYHQNAVMINAGFVSYLVEAYLQIAPIIIVSNITHT
ncbi:hypothetical protein D3C78_1052290 [compost metagenome]